MPFKRQLAQEIVTMLVGAKEAQVAHEQFHRVHQAHQVPENIHNILKVPTSTDLVFAISDGLTLSKSEARRLILQGGVKVNGVVVKDPRSLVSPPAIIQKGPRDFIRVVKG